MEMCSRIRVKGGDDLERWLQENLNISWATGFDKLIKAGTKFNDIFVGCHVAHEIPNCSGMLAKGGLICIENAKMIAELNHEQVKAYDVKVKELAVQSGLNEVQSTEEIYKTHFLLFEGVSD